MRLVFLFLAAASLSACASSPRVATPSIGIAAALAAAGGPSALTFEQAQRVFGTADVSRHEGSGGLLSYRLPGCALALGFAADRSGALRLAAVEVGPPTPRDPNPSLAQCAAAVEERKRKAPGA